MFHVKQSTGFPLPGSCFLKPFQKRRFPKPPFLFCSGKRTLSRNRFSLSSCGKREMVSNFRREKGAGGDFCVHRPYRQGLRLVTLVSRKRIALSPCSACAYVVGCRASPHGPVFLPRLRAASMAAATCPRRRTAETTGNAARIPTERQRKTSGEQNGGPPREPSVSGSRGERRSSGANESSRLREGERYGACDAAVRAGDRRKRCR